MIEIIPAIMPKNYEDLKNKISLIRGISPMVQIDICDGIFVKNRTWPYMGNEFDYNFLKIMDEEEGMPFWEDVDFELDLMIADAPSKMDMFMKLGAKRIVFHYEAVENKEELKNFLEGIDMYMRENLEIGIAFNPDTSVEEIFPLIHYIDFVQCMGIAKIGYQGEPFDERALSNIQRLKEKYPDLPISVDGGVHYDTVSDIIDAGAERLIAGSEIWKSTDIKATIEDLENLV